MGTRSTHRIITKKGEYDRYIQMDGYISGVGMLLLLSVLELMVAFNYDDIMTLFDDSLKVTRGEFPTKEEEQEIERRSGGKPLGVLLSDSNRKVFVGDRLLLSEMVVDYGTLVCEVDDPRGCHYVLDLSKKTFKTHSETLLSDDSEIGFEVPMTVEALLGKAMWFCKPHPPPFCPPESFLFHSIFPFLGNQTWHIFDSHFASYYMVLTGLVVDGFLVIREPAQDFSEGTLRLRRFLVVLSQLPVELQEVLLQKCWKGKAKPKITTNFINRVTETWCN